MAVIDTNVLRHQIPGDDLEHGESARSRRRSPVEDVYRELPETRKD